jgi:hypothetical protein
MNLKEVTRVLRAVRRGLRGDSIDHLSNDEIVRKKTPEEKAKTWQP